MSHIITIAYSCATQNNTVSLSVMWLCLTALRGGFSNLEATGAHNTSKTLQPSKNKSLQVLKKKKRNPNQTFIKRKKSSLRTNPLFVVRLRTAGDSDKEMEIKPFLLAARGSDQGLNHRECDLAGFPAVIWQWQLSVSTEKAEHHILRSQIRPLFASILLPLLSVQHFVCDHRSRHSS